MSMDRSLRSANALARHRNVLTRAERLEKLKEEEKWNDDKSVFGLPKVAHRKMTVTKTKDEAAAVPGAEGAAAAAPGAAPAAAGAKGAAPAAKGAAPAAGAKAPAAAPAAKAAPAKGKK